MTSKTNLSKLIKSQIRKSVGASNNCRIVIVNNNTAPKLKGYSGHYENKSGDVIRYPNAYRKAWGKPIYIKSTLRIEVGAQWLLSSMSLYAFKMHKLRVFQ